MLSAGAIVFGTGVRATERYVLGVIPVQRRNTVVKWLGVRNPAVRETAAIDAPPAARSSLAWSMRRPTTKRWGDSPVLRLKSRAK